MAPGIAGGLFIEFNNNLVHSESPDRLLTSLTALLPDAEDLWSTEADYGVTGGSYR